MSLIQFSIEDPFAVLVMFNQTHAGLTFNRHFALHGDPNENAYIVLKPNEELFGNWTEIIFNSNWHPDPVKGFMKVWIDGKLKVDFKGRSFGKGKKFSLRYGLYASYLKDYRLTQGKEIHPQRIIHFDGIKAEKTCNKLLNKEICQSLTSQTVSKYIKFEHDGNNKKLYDKELLIIEDRFFDKKRSMIDVRILGVCPVAEIMNKQPVILAPNDTIANAMQLMTDKMVRYILIVENEQLLAIVSIGDLVKYIIDQQDQTIQHLNKYISS